MRSGQLVSNPLGDPVGLTWDAMLRSRFGRQENHDELVDAMVAVAGGAGLGARGEIAEASLARFSASRAIRSHAELLARLVAI